MKRRLAVFCAAVIALVFSLTPAVAAYAYTQEDLLREFRTIPAAHWVLADIENLSETMQLSEEQCDALWPLLQRVKQLVPEDNGPSVFHGRNHNNTGRAYSAEVVAQVLDCIRQACRITGCTFVKSLVPDQTHDIDIVFKLYDSRGKLIFEYDGDLVKRTGGDVSESGNGLLFTGVGLFAVAGCGVVFARKKIFGEKA